MVVTAIDERGGVVDERHAVFARADAAEAEVVFSRVGFVGATLAVALVGGVAAAYGTILVGIAHHYDLSLATAGVTLTMNFAGALLGVGATWFAQSRVRGDLVIRAGLAVLAAGLALGALAATWPIFLAGVTVAGVGFGVIDFAVLALMSRTAEEGRANRLSVSSSGWGFGAVAGPLLIAVVRPDHYDVFLVTAAVTGVILIALCRGVHAPVVRADLAAHFERQQPRNRRAVLLTFLPAFAFYVALETGTAGWIATQLHGWGDAAVTGSLVTAGFWAGLAIGRLGYGRVAGRVTDHGIVLGGLVVASALLVGAGFRVLAPFAYPLVGFTLALVFPLGLHWFTRLSPNDHNGVAWLILVDMIGGVLGTGLQSAAVARWGLGAVPVVAVCFAVLCLVTFASALRFPFPDHPARDGSSVPG